MLVLKEILEVLVITALQEMPVLLDQLVLLATAAAVAAMVVVQEEILAV